MGSSKTTYLHPTLVRISSGFPSILLVCFLHLGDERQYGVKFLDYKEAARMVSKDNETNSLSHHRIIT